MFIISTLIFAALCGICARIVGGERFGLKSVDHEYTFNLYIPPIPKPIFSYTFEWSTGWGAVVKYLGKFGWGFLLGYAVTGNFWAAVGTSITWKLGEQWSFHRALKFRTLFNELSGLALKEDFLFFRFCLRATIWVSWTCYLALLTGHYELFILCTYIALFPAGAYLGYKKAPKGYEHATYEILRGFLHGLITRLAIL